MRRYYLTLTLVDPDFPPLDAVMFTVPLRMPDTRPVLLTVALD